MACFVYILKCSDNSYYTGWTTDPERRVRVHNLGNGAKYTRSRRPVTLVYTEELPDKSSALRREIALKKLTHSEKEQLIRQSSEASGAS